MRSTAHRCILPTALTLAPRLTTLQSTNAANLVVSATYPITLSPAFISLIHRRPASVAALPLEGDASLGVLTAVGEEEAPAWSSAGSLTSAAAATTAGDATSLSVDIVVLLHLLFLHGCCGANTVWPAARKAWHGEAPCSTKVATAAAAAAPLTLHLLPAAVMFNLRLSPPPPKATHSLQLSGGSWIYNECTKELADTLSAAGSGVVGEERHEHWQI